MTYKEYLLTCTSEECGEISKELHKALRFGLHDHNPNDLDKKPNSLLIAQEYLDLIATFELLEEEGIFSLEEEICKEDQEDLILYKKDKVKKYWEYSLQSNKLNIS